MGLYGMKISKLLESVTTANIAITPTAMNRTTRKVDKKKRKKIISDSYTPKSMLGKKQHFGISDPITGSGKGSAVSFQPTGGGPSSNIYAKPPKPPQVWGKANSTEVPRSGIKKENFERRLGEALDNI